MQLNELLNFTFHLTYHITLSKLVLLNYFKSDKIKLNFQIWNAVEDLVKNIFGVSSGRSDGPMSINHMITQSTKLMEVWTAEEVSFFGVLEQIGFMELLEKVWPWDWACRANEQNLIQRLLDNALNNAGLDIPRNRGYELFYHCSFVVDAYDYIEIVRKVNRDFQEGYNSKSPSSFSGYDFNDDLCKFISRHMKD